MHFDEYTATLLVHFARVAWFLAPNNIYTRATIVLRAFYRCRLVTLGRLSWAEFVRQKNSSSLPASLTALDA